MSLRDRINQKANESNFSHHPLGKFAAKIDDIVEKEAGGGIVYEINLISEIGKKARVSVWRTSLADEIDAVKRKDANLSDAEARELGEENFIARIARVQRLYSDLGVDIPGENVAGDDADGIANALFEGLGDLITCDCSIAVLENKNAPERGPSIYINAPVSATAAKKPALNSKGARVAAPSSADLGGPSTPDLNDIPFMRRLDEA